MKIYVASSWRNTIQDRVVHLLKNCECGYEVYDFKNPPEKSGFGWEQIGSNWKNWEFSEYKEALKHPIAKAGFNSDFTAMRNADACVLVLPCNRSAHTEAGWFVGINKPVIAYMPVMQEPELMYKMFTDIVSTEIELLKSLSVINIFLQHAPIHL